MELRLEDVGCPGLTSRARSAAGLPSLDQLGVRLSSHGSVSLPIRSTGKDSDEMKPIRFPGGPPRPLSAAFVALTVFLFAGCSAFFRSPPAPLDLPTGATLEKHPGQSRAWWHARFRFFWPSLP